MSKDNLEYYIHLINKYPQADPVKLDGYREHERYVYLNTDDMDLFEIRVDILQMWKAIHREHNLTEPNSLPALDTIENFGLPIHKQKFQREEYPHALRQMEKEVKAEVAKLDKLTTIRKEHEFLNRMWERLSSERDMYFEEIQWLERQWYHRLVGKWFYINGQPMYFPRWCWWFLNTHHVDDGLPDYRDRDRRWYIAQELAALDTMDFVNKDPENGKAIPNKHGEFEMYDTGRKICMGTANTKARRVGDTTKTQSIFEEVSTREKNKNFGIQGKDADNAEDVFKKHFVPNAHKLPWYYRPLAMALFPQEKMEYRTDDTDMSLMNLINFATTADRSLYDGKRLRLYHRDEPGKVKHEDINKAHQVVKQCLTMGMGRQIVGQAFYTTTVDEMNRRGGENYAKLCRDSHYNQRSDNGQTQSGLYNIFFKAEDGLVGFIDEFGFSIIGTPTKEQARFIGSEIGARQWIEADRKIAISNGDFEQLSELKRMYPQSFREAFTPPPQNEYFNTIIMTRNYQTLELSDNQAAVRGNFYWIEKMRTVAFHVHKEGKFLLSKNFSIKETNLMHLADGVYFPTRPDRFVASADAYRLEKTDGGRMSKGGGCVRWLYDSSIDPPGTEVSKYQTQRTVISYLYRPSTMNEYLEDMAMMSIFTGAMMYPEMNVTHVADFFIEHNMDGFLLYDTDPGTGLIKNNPGFTTVGKTKQKLFNLVQSDIEVHGLRNRHIDVMKQCIKIPNMDAMTDYDLFTAYGGTLLGEESKMGANLRSDMENEYDVTDWFDQYEV